MRDGVLLAPSDIVAPHKEKYFHEVAAVRGLFNAYVRKAKPELCDVVDRKVYDITLVIGLEDFLEGIDNFLNINGDMVSICSGDIKK